MTRTVVLLLLVAIVVTLLVTHRLDDDDATTVHARTAPATAVMPAPWESQPSLGEGFGRLVDAMRPKPRPRARIAPTSAHGHPCGGDLPPCWVMLRESGGNIHAYNPTGCGGRGCRGKWQCDPRTCSGQGTEAQQDAEARRVWDHGRGCAHWAAC